MKSLYTIFLASFALILLTACGGKKTTEQLLIGDWVAAAPINETENGMSIKFTDMNTSFNKDNTTASSGTISMSGALLPQAMEMTIATTGTWSLEGMVITQQINEADVKMTTQIPGMPDMGPIIAEGMKAEGATTSTILSIDKKILKIKNDDTGTEIDLKRK
jgi:hypothetical protein